MFRIIALVVMFVALSACSRDLHFSIRFAEIGSLQEGAPLVANGRQVGEVAAIAREDQGGYLVGVDIDRQHQGVATEDSNFVLADDPDDLSLKRIEIVQSRPGGRPIAEDAIVPGTYPTPFGTFPFGALLKEFGKAMKDLSGQVERYRKDFEQLPNSPEGKQLQEEWRRLLEELLKAQNATEGTLRRDVAPRLQEELENLRKRLEELRQPPPKQGKPLET